MTSNRQHPPQTSLGHYSGFVTRLVAWIIDCLLLTATVTITAGVISFLANNFRINEILGLGGELNQIAIAISVGLALFLPPIYNMVMWILAGQTVGKWIMGVRVVRTNGQGVTFWVALRRQIGYFISAILFLGFIWILFDNRRQGFHDRLAGTFVVYSWPEIEEPVKPVKDRARSIRLQRKMAEEQG
jgi:uncharacterized RDD family membrane protein YckC